MHLYWVSASYAGRYAKLAPIDLYVMYAYVLLRALVRSDVDGITEHLSHITL